MQQVSELYSQLAHPNPQVYFIWTKVAQTDRAVVLAGNNVPKITAALPSVKLPTSNPWMSHTEAAGSDGTIRVEVTQIGSAVSVRQTWSGGDGGMAGTVIIHLRRPIGIGDRAWTVVVEPAERRIRGNTEQPIAPEGNANFSRRPFDHYCKFHLFSFADPAEPRDAYAYFLYHQQLGCS